MPPAAALTRHAAARRAAASLPRRPPGTGAALAVKCWARPVSIGAKLGPYEVLRFIGQGGTASVFEARHALLGKLVAIKVLHEHLASDPAVAGRFVQEARITAQLRHPHAIDVLDVGEDRGVAYLVMELLSRCPASPSESPSVACCPSTRRSGSCFRWRPRSPTRTRRGSSIAT